MKKLLFLFLPVFLLVFFGCRNDKKSSSKGSQEVYPIYFDYEISGEEGFDKLTILARFREGGKSEETITLHDPAKVELDGEVLPADSAGLSGTFYELNKPIETFSGKHIIAFTDFDENIYKEEFEFEPIALTDAIADTLHRDNVSFSITGIAEDDLVKIIMTDTSFVNDGVNKHFAVKNGRIELAVHDLASLANGPIQLELIKEENKDIENGTPAGGRLRTRYVLRRSFILED